jgi:hypothetical protein
MEDQKVLKRKRKNKNSRQFNLAKRTAGDDEIEALEKRLLEEAPLRGVTRFP